MREKSKMGILKMGELENWNRINKREGETYPVRSAVRHRASMSRRVGGELYQRLTSGIGISF